MNIENFITFVNFFKQAGFDLNASNPDGMTMVQIMEQHKQGADYAKAMLSAGANG